MVSIPRQAVPACGPLRRTATGRLVHATREVSRFAPSEPLRLTREKPREAPARVRVGVAVRLAEEWIPDGLAKDAVLEPIAHTAKGVLRTPLGVPVVFLLAPRPTIAPRYANPAIGERSPARRPASRLRPGGAAHQTLDESDSPAVVRLRNLQLEKS